MEVEYSPTAKNDIEFWKKSGNKKIQKKITELLLSIVETPFDGIGKPEPLKHDYSGWWSRRINREHRIVYEVLENKIIIYSFKGHYQ
jgi:toxin YoeB